MINETSFKQDSLSIDCRKGHEVVNICLDDQEDCVEESYAPEEIEKIAHALLEAARVAKANILNNKKEKLEKLNREIAEQEARTEKLKEERGRLTVELRELK